MTRIIVGEPDALNSDLDRWVPGSLGAVSAHSDQRLIPGLARDHEASALIESAVQQIPSCHELYCGDARFLSGIEDKSVHLIVTSPPYWTLKKYPENEAQLGQVEDYERFLSELDAVWQHCFRLLAPGGRLVIVVGDVCLPRRRYGRHVVFPLHASIQEHCRGIGFDNLAPIIWHKIANAQFEVEGGSSFLGKPYEPNAVVKNDIEFILFQRRPGGYRQPTSAARVLSLIPSPLHHQLFQQIWTLNGASTREHPAPFPLALAERLVRMFSFVGDTVLDPFMGSGTTNLAAARLGRNSIGVEIEESYFEQARRRLQTASHRQGRFGHIP